MMDVKDLPYLPIPHITKLTRAYSHGLTWFCRSDEYCTWDGKDGFHCGGLGKTPEEAYADWLENYVHDRYLEDEGE